MQLNRPLRVLYAIGKAEFERFTQEGKSPNASTIYRVIMPAVKIMETGELDIRIADEFVMQNGTLAPDKYNPNVGWADIIVFPRIMNIDPKFSVPIVRAMQARGKVIVFEHDDYYFKLSRSTYNRHTFAAAPHLESTRLLIKHADMITSPNHILNEESLKQAVRVKKPLERVIQNAVSLEEWDDAAQYRKKHKKVRILLSGAMNHYIDWLSIFPVLKTVKEKYGDAIEIHMQGLDKRAIPQLKNNRSYTPHFYYDSLEVVEKYDSLGTTYHLPTDLQDFSAMLNTITPDIGIIVTGTEVFDRCKSTLKFADYTMAGAAVICSRHEPYTNEFVSGKDIWFAETSEEWVDGLSMLIDMPEMRKKIHKNADVLVRQKYSLEAITPLWIQAFKDAYSSVHGNIIDLQ